MYSACLDPSGGFLGFILACIPHVWTQAVDGVHVKSFPTSVFIRARIDLNPSFLIDSYHFSGYLSNLLVYVFGW